MVYRKKGESLGGKKTLGEKKTQYCFTHMHILNTQTVFPYKKADIT